MIWRLLATWGLASVNGGGGATGRDLRSIPNIHWSDFLWNSADPADLSGNASSATLANMMNPAGFSAGPPGLNPNNNVNPTSGPVPPQAASGPPGSGPGGMYGSGMMTGVSPQQQMALLSAYNNFMQNLGIPGNGFNINTGPSPTAPAPMDTPPDRGSAAMGEYPGLMALSRMPNRQAPPMARFNTP